MNAPQKKSFPETGLMTKADKERARKFMLWLGIIAIVIFFGGFTSAYIVRMNDKSWFSFEIPVQFTYSTIVLLMSSVTMIFAMWFTKNGKRWPATIFFFLTLILGFLFSRFQWEGWKELVKNDIYFSDPRTSNVSGSLFYVITGMHLAHLIGGLIALLVTTVRSGFGKYKPDDYLGAKLSAIYWHFLDVLWLYLFLFLNYIEHIL